MAPALSRGQGKDLARLLEVAQVVVTKGADNWLVRILRSRGHQVESLRMCKLLANSL